MLLVILLYSIFCSICNTYASDIALASSKYSNETLYSIQLLTVNETLVLYPSTSAQQRKEFQEERLFITKSGIYSMYPTVSRIIFLINVIYIKCAHYITKRRILCSSIMIVIVSLAENARKLCLSVDSYRILISLPRLGSLGTKY